MYEGKKSTAFQIFYDAMDIVKEKLGEDEHEAWKKALNNAMPQVEVRSRRIGGATFQIPTELPANRKISIGMKWLITFARKRSGKGMADKLSAEIIAASIRKYIPGFTIEYKVDPLRQSRAESWPNSLDDTCARKEWDWAPTYDLDMMTQDMLKVLKAKFNK